MFPFSCYNLLLWTVFTTIGLERWHYGKLEFMALFLNITVTTLTAYRTYICDSAQFTILLGYLPKYFLFEKYETVTTMSYVNFTFLCFQILSNTAKNILKINFKLSKIYGNKVSGNKTMIMANNRYAIFTLLNKIYVNSASTAYTNKIIPKINHIMNKIHVNEIFKFCCIPKFWIHIGFVSALTEKSGFQIQIRFPNQVSKFIFSLQSEIFILFFIEYFCKKQNLVFKYVLIQTHKPLRLFSCLSYKYMNKLSIISFIFFLVYMTILFCFLGTVVQLMAGLQIRADGSFDKSFGIIINSEKKVDKNIDKNFQKNIDKVFHKIFVQILINLIIKYFLLMHNLITQKLLSHILFHSRRYSRLLLIPNGKSYQLKVYLHEMYQNFARVCITKSYFSHNWLLNIMSIMLKDLSSLSNKICLQKVRWIFSVEKGCQMQIFKSILGYLTNSLHKIYHQICFSIMIDIIFSTIQIYNFSFIFQLQLDSFFSVETQGILEYIYLIIISILIFKTYHNLKSFVTYIFFKRKVLISFISQK